MSYVIYIQYKEVGSKVGTYLMYVFYASTVIRVVLRPDSPRFKVPHCNHEKLPIRSYRRSARPSGGTEIYHEVGR